MLSSSRALEVLSGDLLEPGAQSVLVVARALELRLLGDRIPHALLVARLDGPEHHGGEGGEDEVDAEQSAEDAEGDAALLLRSDHGDDVADRPDDRGDREARGGEFEGRG